MTTARRFADLWTQAQGLEPVTVAVAGGGDAEVMRSLQIGVERELISGAVVTGDPAMLAKLTPPSIRSKLEIAAATDVASCAQLAVKAVRDGRASILMKGSVDSGAYLRAIVDREAGLRASNLLSNVTVAEMVSYHKLIVATDNGITPFPTLDQKRAIITNAGPLFLGLGVAIPKVALIAATEKVSAAMPGTKEALELAGGAGAGDLKNFVIDGPLGYDAAMDYAAAVTKGLHGSPVAGDPDLLMFSNIDAANAVAKSWKLHGQAKTGSLVLGAAAPVLLNSRSDDAERRLNALLLARVTQAHLSG